MEKTKLGLSVTLMGALCCLMGIFGGYTVIILLTGYILICEKNRWLRSFSVSVLCICLVFSLILSGLGFLDNILLASDAGATFLSVLTLIVRAVGKLILLALGIASLLGVKVRVPVIADFLDKHLSHPDEEESSDRG